MGVAAKAVLSGPDSWADCIIIQELRNKLKLPIVLPVFRLSGSPPFSGSNIEASTVRTTALGFLDDTMLSAQTLFPYSILYRTSITPESSDSSWTIRVAARHSETRVTFENGDTGEPTGGCRNLECSAVSAVAAIIGS